MKRTINRNKLYFLILVLVLAGIVVTSSIGVLGAGKEEESYRVSVIVNDSNNDRWISLRQGLEQAASDNNVNLNYVSTATIKNVDEELELIRREVENGADGIIVQMVSSVEVSEELTEIADKTAIMLLETDVEPEDLYPYTGPDNVAIGTAVAEAIKADFGEDLAGIKIGVICPNQKQLSMKQRLGGLEESLSGSKGEIIWIQTQSGQQVTEAVDVIAALDNQSLEEIVDAKLKVSLYGVGCSEKTVYDLDKGYISGLVVPNEFNMGYQSVAEMANKLKYRLTEVKGNQVDYLVVDRETLYEEDNQKILFPIVQ